MLIKTLLTSIFLLVAFTAVSEAENILETDAGNRIHARLQNETLEEVSVFFKQNFNIKFIGEEDLFQSKVTVSFDNLSLEKALKKIFAKTNVAFKYDSQGKITEVRLLPTSKIKYNPAKANAVNNINQQTPAIDQHESNDQPPESSSATNEDSTQTGSAADSTADGVVVEPHSPSPDDSAEPETAPDSPSEGD